MGFSSGRAVSSSVLMLGNDVKRDLHVDLKC